MRRFSVQGLLAAAFSLTGCSLLTPSGPGMPAGPSYRTRTHVLTLIATDEPHAPALQPNQIPVVPRKVGLLLTPLDGSGAGSVVEIAGGVPPSSDPDAVRILAVSGDRVWIRANGIYVYDLGARRVSKGGEPPQDAPSRTFTNFVSTGWLVSPTRWLGVHVPEDVEKGKLKPGSPVMPNIFPLRSIPYEPIGFGLIPTREKRRLYVGQIDTSGPIPRFSKTEAVSADEYSNGVVFTDSVHDDGGLIAYEGRFPDLTLHVRRIDAEGRTQWTVDTRITRDPQALPEGDLLALRGFPLVELDKFAQPILVLLNMRTGHMTTSELKWP